MKQSMGMGGSIVSKNILDGKGQLKWCIREEPVNKIDNGWRFLSDADTDELLSTSGNMIVCDWGTIFEIEPAIMAIFDLPVGTDVTLVDDDRKYFVYTDSGEEVKY